MKGAKCEIGFDLPANYDGIEVDETTIVCCGQTPFWVSLE
jgi:hypothetical protein